jgi:ATP phosphoribosyltransferase
MIKMALPNKGQLFEPCQALMAACGYKAKKSDRALTCIDMANGIEFYFLRPNDIPMYVGEGVIDIGITGIDFNAEKNGKASKVLDLHFGHSKLCAAVPNESPIQTLEDLRDLRIGTSFGGIVCRHFNDENIKIVPLEGAVEISIALGVCDAIVDIVETGSTLKQAGLRILGEPLFHSNAAIFAHPGKENLPEILRLQKRIEGYLVALEYMMVEYDVPQKTLEQACVLTPGIESPTISTLRDPEWFSVKSMIKKNDSNRIMDELSDIGCKGIVLTAIQSARI